MKYQEIISQMLNQTSLVGNESIGMYRQLGYEPKTVYHFTKVKNAKSIIKDGELKAIAIDGLCWVCDSFENVQKVAELTLQNVGGTFVNAFGKIARYEEFTKSDYVVLKINPKRSKNWVLYVDQMEEEFKSSNIPYESANKYSIAHIDNIKIFDIEVLDLDGNLVDLKKDYVDVKAEQVKIDLSHKVLIDLSKALAKQIAGINY